MALGASWVLSGTLVALLKCWGKTFMIYIKIFTTADNTKAAREQEAFLYTAAPRSAVTTSDGAAAPSAESVLPAGPTRA